MKRIFEYEDLRPVFDQLLQDKESSEIEFKTAAGGFPRSFWETYSAFANTNGGAIIFGIKEKNDQLSLDGLTIEQVKKYEKDFFNNMHSKDNVNLPLLADKDVEYIEFEGSYFLFFYVPRVEVSQRPVYCGKDPYGGTFRRDLDGDYHCTRQEVSSMFADANQSKPVDGRILKNYGIEDLDQASIKQYRRLFEQANPDHVWNSLDDSSFLEKLNVIRKDRETGEKGLTYAGLLMFGTYSAITDENPNFFPDYQEIEDRNSRWVNRIIPDGNWESNLFQFYRRVLPVLQSFLPKPFILEDNQRKNETSAHVSVREAFANCLIHADYTENASLNVTKYPNKIVFANPGMLLISMKQFYKGGESVCRNKYLQTMFTFLGAAEKAGSGADKILRGWEEQNWKKPYLEEKSKPNKVVLTMTMESLMDDSIKQALQERFGVKYEPLSHHERLTLSLAYTEEEVTNERLQYVLNLHKADITKLLQNMCKSELLVSTGRGRGTKYHVYGNVFTLENSNLSEFNSNLSCGNSNLSEINSNLSCGNSNLPIHKKRYSKKELQNLIVEFCSEWRSSEEIANAVGKSPDYILNKVLPDMMNLLEKKYDVPRHPKQKYRKKQDSNGTKV